MGLIRPLVYMTIGFVAGNIYHGCAETRYEQRTRQKASLEERIDKESNQEYRVQHAKAD